MKRLAAVALALLLATGTALAQEEKPFLHLVKGNFWKYDVEERGEKKSGKIEIEKIDKDSRYRVKASNMEDFPSTLSWKIADDTLTWEIIPGFNWKVLKFSAKKGDSWESRLNLREMKPEEETVLESTVTAVEDVQTPAGKFTGCLKVETTPSKEPGIISTWWARGVGLVKLETAERGETKTSWVLSSYKVGYEISDEKLKEMVEEADVVALIAVPKDAAGAKKAKVKLGDLYKGEVEEKEGQITVLQPKEGEAAGKFEQGDFVIFLKEEGDTLVMLHGAQKADRVLLERLTRLVTPPERSIERVKELCRQAKIVAAVEIVVLEDRQTFRYYVAKVIGSAKGAGRRRYLDVLSVPEMSLEKGKKYILILEETEKSGRKLMQLVDTAAGVFEYDEGLLNKLGELCRDSDNDSTGE